MFTLGLIGNNKEIQHCFRSLTDNQQDAICGIHIIEDTFDESSSQIQRPSFQSIEQFPSTTTGFLFLSEVNESITPITQAIKCSKNVFLASYCSITEQEVERLEKLSKEAQSCLVYLPSSDFINTYTNFTEMITYYVHREKSSTGITANKLVPLLYTDLLLLHKLTRHNIDRIKVPSSPRLMGKHAPFVFLASYANGLNASLIYHNHNNTNKYTLYNEQTATTMDIPNKADKKINLSNILELLRLSPSQLCQGHEHAIMRQVVKTIGELQK